MRQQEEVLSPVSIQTQSLVLRNRKPQETRQSWLPLLRPSIPIGCLPTQALAFLAVFVYATHAMQAIAFEWKPGFTVVVSVSGV